MRKMQEFAPEMQRLKAKYGNDKQKLAAEMQKLQSQQGVNPLGGCLPVLVQVPVFIGLFHVLREFEPGKTENYIFDASEVESFNAASLFGAKLGAWVTMGAEQLEALGTTMANQIIVMIPLMIAAGIFTHITARHSVARQTEAQAANPQAAIMNKLMLYVFPIGVVVGAPFLPLAVLLYWVSNNLWTLGQQYVVYKKIDAEESEKKTQAVAERQARAPRPGQKPNRPETARSEKTPGAKPIARRTPATDGSGATAEGDAATANGEVKRTEVKDGGVNGGSGKAGTDGAGSNGAATGRPGTGGSTRPPARRPRKRR
jgi:YidC/Oxa1 family membrane protein insertase